jgi:uncharacterized protein with GYD domain
MPKFLVQGSYTSEGAKGIAREGASARRSAVEQMISKLGGKVEAFYFAFGESDVYVIVDVPDNQTATAFALAVNQSGAVTVRTVVLMTPEEVDQALKKQVEYRAPGR